MNDYYKVYSDVDLEILMSSVNSKMKEGWKVAGGICVTIEKLNANLEPDPKGKEMAVYYQALTII